ncbi:MAG: ribonuclease Z [Planctomycetota bacterium]|nr:ribonuclease Z [Planctomycetota bacterium]
MASPPRLIVLGSGTSVPRADRATSCYLVDPGDGRAVLVDLGPGSLHRAAAAGYDLDHLHGVLMTHIHPDHSADLAALDFALRHPGPRAGLPPLPVWGHAAVTLLHARLRNAWPGWLGSGPERLDMQVIGPGELEVPGFTKAEAFQICHAESSLGYRLTLPNGFQVAFSGDASEGAQLEELGHQSDLFVLEAAAPHENPVRGHLSPERAAAVASSCQAKHLMLTHFYPEVLADPVEPRVRTAFEGRLSLAQDGMIIELVC